MAVISIGGATNVEMKEKWDRVEDALQAVHSAQQEGIIPGGGAALLKAWKLIEDNFDKKELKCEHSFTIMRQALHAPLLIMLQNAGTSKRKIKDVMEVVYLSQGLFNGYYIREEKWAQLRETGIIDPCKVTRCALQNAVSAAGTLLTTNVAIVDLVDK